MRRTLFTALLAAAAVAFFCTAAQAQEMQESLRYRPMGLDRTFAPSAEWTDCHTHLSLGTADSVVAHMDSWGIKRMVVLALPGDDIDSVMAEFGRYPDRFAVMYPIHFEGVNERGWKKNLEHQVRHAHEIGCRGIKLYKDFSVYLKDKEGKNIPVDSPLYDPLWKTAGELGMPIVVHVGDPERFWMPPDSEANYIETDDWAFYGTGVPFREELVRELENVIRNNPGTTFIGAHVGNRSEEPMIVSYLLDKYPNYYVDLAARYGELSKNMRATRWLLMQHPDKIVFGTDWGVWARDAFPASWAGDAKTFYQRAERILATRDHLIPTPFDGNEGPYLVATHRWACDGWEIPADVLKQICEETPSKIFFPN